MHICNICQREFNSKQQLGGHKSACGIIRKKRKYQDPRIYGVCLNCNNNITTRNTVGKFCCKNCQLDFQYKKYIEEWHSGLQDGRNGEFGISKHIKKYLFEKYNCKCSKCGWSEKNEFTNRQPLQVHHIDGHYTNNKEENLILLCPNCHSLTENWGARNKANGGRNYGKYRLVV